MTLATIITGERAPVSRKAIGGDRALAIELQQELARLGLLDGEPDGKFGPVSNWALDTFVNERVPGATELGSDLARALQEADPWPLVPGSDLAGRVTRAMVAKGYSFVRHPTCINIVYVEGMSPDGTANGNAPNRFNDLRMVIRCDAEGVPRADLWDGTTEPGKYYTEHRENAAGAARIAFGQYKAWHVGIHPHDPHEALVQVDEIVVCRDGNEDFNRVGDPEDRGLFGINQHWGWDLPTNDIKNASAGCLVGRTKAGHRAFMALVKADARFKVSNGYRFQTAVMPAAEVPS